MLTSQDQAATDADADAVDPLAALLRMGFCARARFLLEAARNGAAAQPLLRALLAAARHSSAAAEQVAATPRLLRALREMFIEAPSPDSHLFANADAEPSAAPPHAQLAGVAGSEAAAAAEYWAARAAALRLLRALARASPAAAAAVAAEGAVAAAAARFSPLPAAAEPEAEQVSPLRSAEHSRKRSRGAAMVANACCVRA